MFKPLRVLAAPLSIAAVSLAAAAPVVAADVPTDPHCEGDRGRTYNACLRLTIAPYSFWDAHVGLDAYMQMRYAEELIACGTDIRATLYGDDGGGSKDQVLGELSVDPGWPVAWSRGLSAELTQAQARVDEDKGADQDELYAIVSYTDCFGVRQSHRTGEIRGNFNR
jgi:hypothetical protein